MKTLLAIFITFIISLNVTAEEQTKDPAIIIATNYFNALVIGELETADKLVGFPSIIMNIDKVLTTTEEVMAKHREMFNEKGKRDVPKTEISKPTDYIELNKDTFNVDYEVVSMKLLEGKYKGDSLNIYVRNNDGEYKVIGLLL